MPRKFLYGILFLGGMLFSGLLLIGLKTGISRFQTMIANAQKPSPTPVAEKPTPFDVGEAMKNGKSPYEIIAYVATQSGMQMVNVPAKPKDHFDVGKAVNDGVSYYDIISFLASDATQSATPMIPVDVPQTPPRPEIKYVQQRPAVKCVVVANAYQHFTQCCDAQGSCTAN